MKSIKQLLLIIVIGVLFGGIFLGAFFSVIFMQHIPSLPPPELLVIAKEKFHIVPKGLIHIGASTGEEANFYKSLDVQRVMWIEADPDTFKQLVQSVKPDGFSIIAENFAASDKDGATKFLRTNNHVSSSLLPLKEHKIIWPDIVFRDEINVTTKRLDTYFLQAKNKASDYNVMVIDIQGAELFALRGAVDTLKNIECIISEISYVDLYEGGVRIWELDEFLLKHGFVRTETYIWHIGVGDALYIRKKNFEINK